MKIKAYSSFYNYYKELPDRIQKKVDKQIKYLSMNVNYPSLHTKKMKGFRNIWETRIDKNYRMTFEIINDTIFLRVVGNHEEALNKP